MSEAPATTFFASASDIDVRRAFDCVVVVRKTTMVADCCGHVGGSYLLEYVVGDYTGPVEENKELIQHVKLFFVIGNENMILPAPPKPAVSAHSSNTTLSPPHQIFLNAIEPSYSIEDDGVETEETGDEDEDDEEEEYSGGGDETKNIVGDDDDGNEKEQISGFEFVKETNDHELLQVGMSGDMIMLNDGSNNLDTHFNLLATSLDRDDNSLVASTQDEEILAPEDSRYSYTVSTIIQNQLTRRSNHSQTPASYHSSLYSTQSSFTTWTTTSNHQQSRNLPTTSTSQRLLKYILFTIPFLHSSLKTADVDASDSVASGLLRKTTSQEELISANHVLAERRRREKLNERFIMLRTLVPLVTKMDKASILDDTIEYVKQLRRKIYDLESRCPSDKSKVRAVEGGRGGGGGKAVEVSIIENDALVEMQCRHREGLLLDVMKKLRELGVEVTTVESCVDGGMFTAEMRAKVKVRKGNNGKKISIMQVRKAIDQTISPS
ncbi:hypothetical protein QVD17_15378 [Tagetes erecta]|uniref:BHLH domain-containing protein n=1 Tax=Tagetes erecta TaxID=13708 RepID=A0AAD8KPU9_TARER|nr:hypothetical protein QVD17_15378 [Tagetes erecta]